MEGGNNQLIYLNNLLKIKELDIQKISRDNLTLRVGDYFKAVEKFFNRVPIVLEALGKIAAEKAVDYDFRVLKDVQPFLEDVGYFRIIAPFEKIFGANKRGHGKFAVESANEIMADVTEVCSFVTTAQKEYMAGAALPVTDDYRTQLLKDVLQLLASEGVTRKTKLKILAVDDSPVALKNIHTSLIREYDVFGMANPTMVEAFLQRLSPDLFLLDYQMPGINGFELVPIIRNFPEHKETPIIFLTGMSTPDYVNTALSLGACDYIVKPFSGENLRAKIAKHINRKKPQ